MLLTGAMSENGCGKTTMQLEQWLACFHSNLCASQAQGVFSQKLKNPPRALSEFLNAQCGDLLPLIQGDLTWLDGNDTHHIISYEDTRYPPLLRKIQNAPCVLFVRGDADVLRFPPIAVVGPRKPSSEGLYNAQAFVKSLSDCGFCIVSGMAAGVDGKAHNTTLENPEGRTVAVIGTGIDRIYPHFHQSLDERIVKSTRGAILSVFPRNAPPRAAHFPARNKIISGMSMAVLVVEAGVRSGAMITARCAGEQGRDVFAIPGSIHAPLSIGCNKLISDGAFLTANKDDMLKQIEPIYASYAMELNPRITSESSPAADTTDSKKQKHAHNISPSAQKILSLLDYHDTHPDILAKNAKISVTEIIGFLTELEISGLIVMKNGLYRKTPLADRKRA